MAESNLAISLQFFSFKYFTKEKKGKKILKKKPDSKQMELSRITHTGELN